MLGGASRQICIRFPNGEYEDITSGIVSGSTSLERILCAAENLNFGECNATKFEIEISNIEDIAGLKIQAYANVTGYEEEVILFTGYVDSAKAQPEQETRKVIAYDELKKHADDNVSEWYNSQFPSEDKSEYKGVWSGTEKYLSKNTVNYDGSYYQYLCASDSKVSIVTGYDDDGNEITVTYTAADYLVGKTPVDILADANVSQYIQALEVYNPVNYGYVTVKEFRDALFKYVGISQEENTLINDDIQITKTLDSNEIKFSDCIKAICQINAVFGHISESGIFKYVSLGGTAEDFSGNYKATNTAFEEYSAKAIDSVRLYGNTGDITTIYGAGTNYWSISNNFLLYNLSTEVLEGIAKNLYGAVKDISYTPVTMEALLSVIPVSMGAPLIFTTHTGQRVTSYVLKDRLSGPQLTNQTIEADGNKIRDSSLSTTDLLGLLSSKTTAIVEKVYKKITADSAEIKIITGELANYKVVVAESLQVINAEIKNVKADYGEYKKLVTQQFEAEAARIDVISGDLADYKTVVADEFTAVTGRIDTVSGDLADYKVVIAGELDAHTALLEQITANQITTEYLNTYYANINLANIDIANIEKAKIGELFAEMGLISTAVIENGHVTGYLDSVSINANAIRAGTLSVDRLIINGSEESIIYALNNAGELTSTSVDTLDGGLLTDRTITADKLVAHSITANEITTSNIIGANGWINLAQGTFNYGNQLIWDGSELYISAETITMVTDGRYATQDDHNDLADRTATLELSADNFAVELASTQKTVSDNYVTLQDYTDAAKASAISTAAADATAKADNALTAAKADATSKANKALSDAKADATTKANQALSDAKADATAKADAALSDAMADATAKANKALSDAMDALDITNATVAVHAETISDHETRIAATEDEISLKVSTKDFSSYQTTVTGQISAAKASAINTAASDATTKANQALSDAKADATAKADAAKASAVSTAATDATTKANNAKNAAITAAAADATTKANAAQSAAISTAASDATAKANQALIDANEYTAAEITTVNESLSITNQEINIMKGQIALKVEQTDIDTAVTNLQIGGRNLLRNSNFATGDSRCWANISATMKVMADATFGHALSFVTASPGSSSYRIYNDINHFTHTSGETYTLSFYIRADSSTTVQTSVAASQKIKVHEVTTEWVRHTVTYTAGMSGSITFWPVAANITIYLANVKLEKGNKATDWTPAPEDVDSSISAVNAKFASYSTTSEMESAITVAKSEITSEVSEKYSTKAELETVDGKVTTLEEWQSEASQKITKDGIIATVGNYYAYQSDLDTVENRVTEAESQILQQADEIELRVEKSGIISAINQTAETVKIAATRITLAGATIADSFTATNLHVTGNSVFDGTLRATKGTIAGWNINSTSISTTNSSGNYIYFGNASSANQDVLFVQTGAGTTASPYSYPVIIRGNGYAEFSNAKISGTITAKSLTAYDSISMRSSDGVINKVIGYSSSGQFWLGGTPSGATTQLTTIYGPVTVYGDATHSVLTCGKIQTEDIDITRDYSVSWINALQGHAAINISQAGDSSGFNALARVMTTNGAWTIGTLNSNNGFYIAYGNATRLANGANGTDSDFAVLANGDVYVRGMIEFKDWNGTKRSPISSASTDSNRVSYIASKVNSSGTYYITVQGQFGTTGSTYVAKNISTNTSDVRLKCNIVDTKVAALPVINQMAIRAFDWLESGIHRSIGFVADELEAIDPALAFGGGYDDDGTMIEKNVDVFYLAGYLTKGIQELYSAQVEMDERLVVVENWKESVEDQLMDAREEIVELRAELAEARNEIEQLKLQASAA